MSEERICTLANADFAALAEEVMARGKGLRFRARGTSMAPFINDGDAVLISPLKGSPGLGDVVLVKTGGQGVYLHRVVKARRGRVITRGDARRIADDPVSPAAVLGRVTAVPGRGRNLHLRFPFKYLVAARPLAASVLSLPGLRPLGRAAARMLA